MIDLLITGGIVATPSGVGMYDLAVRGGIIVAVLEPQLCQIESAKVIDATGKIVVPGGIEPHAHIGGPRQPERSGAGVVSRAAIYGGTTTIFDFATQIPGHDLWHALDEAQERWNGNAYTDYSYHPIFAQNAGMDCIEQIPGLIERGFPSFKVFTTSIRPPDKGIQNNHTDFGRLCEIMSRIASNDGVLMVHSEDDEIVSYNYSRAKGKGEWDWWNMHHIHSNLSEDVSFRRVIRLSEQVGSAIYFVHVSAKEGVIALAEARRKGLPVYGETLHNYACFNAENYREKDGMKYHTYPSLKSEEDRTVLWDGLLDGRLSTLATDLVSTTWDVKTMYKTVADVTGGHNGIETRMGIAYTEGVVKKGMSLERFVDITSSNAARIFGIYPKKGAIAVGSDADITILDPAIQRKLRMDDLHLEDYSIWEGWDIRGWPVTTILRGKVMVEDSNLLGTSRDGKLLSRKIDPRVLSHPIC